MLASPRFDQTIERIVRVVRARLHALIAEEDRLLRVVAKVRHVADRVIRVVEVLQRHAAARRHETRETERERIVLEGRPRSVPQLQRGSLALGVVVDVRHRMDARRCGREHRRGLGALIEPRIYPFEQTRFVVCRLEHAEHRAGLVAVRRNDLNGSAERVVARTAPVDRDVERNRARPIERFAVHARKLSLAPQRVALEVECCAGGHAGLVEHPGEPTAQIVRLGVRCRFAVHTAPHHLLVARTLPQKHIGGPAKRVVGESHAMVAAVPRI